MTFIEMAVATDLAREVSDWAREGALLAGLPGGPRPGGLVLDDLTVSLEIVPPAEYGALAAVDYSSAHRESLQYLFDMLGMRFSFIDSWCPATFGELVSHHHEKLWGDVAGNSRIGQIAKALATIAGGGGQAAAGLVRDVEVLVAESLYWVVRTRVLTLSRRFAPAEAVFAAAKLGALPVALQWSGKDFAVLCIDPAMAVAEAGSS